MASAYGIVVCWLTLLILGRWKPELRWKDRLGRLLGFCWIVLALGTTPYRALLKWLMP